MSRDHSTGGGNDDQKERQQTDGYGRNCMELSLHWLLSCPSCRLPMRFLLAFVTRIDSYGPNAARHTVCAADTNARAATWIERTGNESARAREELAGGLAEQRSAVAYEMWLVCIAGQRGDPAPGDHRIREPCLERSV
jgi:hypothetical protein